jgi:hypothetical protein
MPDFDLDSYKAWYRTAWKGVFTYLLRWEPAVIDRWLSSQAFVLDLEATYHETPTYDVFPELIPPGLKKTLHDADRCKLESLLEKAFRDGQTVWPGNEGYDWTLARENVNTVLAQYGYPLP